MNLDQLGRQAGAEVRLQTNRGVPTMTMLDELRSTDRRRKTTGAVVVVAVVALLGALGWRVLGGPGTVRQGPATTPSPPVSAPLASGESRFNLAVPVTVTLPPHWTGSPSTPTTADFDSDEVDYGVSVDEGVRPALPTATAQVAPAGGTDARSIATWLASRPYLVGSTVTATTLGGRPAWQVDTRSKPGTRVTSSRCGYFSAATYSCVPLLLGAAPTDHMLGISEGARFRWVLTDLPDGTVGVVWVWDYTGAGLGFAKAQPVLDTLRFG